MLPSNRQSVSGAKAAATASFMSRVYFWMMAGIFISGVTAFAVASTPNLIRLLTENSILFIGIVVLQLVAVIALSAAVQRMSLAMAAACYAFYATLVGLTFSVLLLVYTMESISLTFFTTAFAFGGLSAVGYMSKRDLGPIGSFCTMGLFGLLAVILIGVFVPSIMTNSMQLTISVLGILIFSGLTAYDTQKIKALQYQFASEEDAKKGAIRGALILYLDFINLFISLLRLMGDRR